MADLNKNIERIKKLLPIPSDKIPADAMDGHEVLVELTDNFTDFSDLIGDEQFEGLLEDYVDVMEKVLAQSKPKSKPKASTTARTKTSKAPAKKRTETPVAKLRKALQAQIRILKAS